MSAKLSADLSEALDHCEGSLSVVDPRTDRTYVLVEQAQFSRAKKALEREEEDVVAAIQRGLDDAEAGQVMTLEESEARIDAALSRFSA